MPTLTTTPSHTVRAMEARARRIADEMGIDAPRFHRLACACRAELQSRRADMSDRLAVLSTQYEEEN
jgi:hypothetical protein